jgi:hypothetical protein
MSSEAVAQHRTFRILKQYREPVMLHLVRGDTLLVNCDSAIVYNMEAQSEMRRKDSLISAYGYRVAIGDSIKLLKDSVVFMYRQIAKIQNQAYDTLRAHFSSADSLVKVSIANTSDALSYIKKVKVTSFLASGLAGGILGGLGFKSGNNKPFNWPGAAGGALIGMGVNWLFLKVFD